MVRIAVVVLVLAGCKDDCAEARKAASASVDEALSDSIRDGQLLANLVDGPRLQAEVVRDARDELEPSLVTLAEHLNCKRFATLDATAKAAALESAKIFSPELLLPHSISGREQILPLFAPLVALLAKADSVASMSAKDAGAWCTSVQAATATLRAESPAAWQRMIAGLEKDEVEARANRKAHEQREMTLHGWSAAIGNSKPADPAEGSAADLAPVRAKVARYTKACTN